MSLSEKIDRQGVHSAPFGKLPALYALHRSLPQCSSNASAMMLLAELPVQRKRTL